jgi:hypothetical protein
MHSDETLDNRSGPLTYLNWLASRREPLLVTHEYPLYTDAHIVAETNHGPYRFLHTLSMSSPGVVRPAVVLRWDWHYDIPHPDFSKTNAEQYHGGNAAEEIAALASLALGVRFRAGDLTREFIPGGDPKGQPWGLTRRPTPILGGGTPRSGWIIPNAAEGQHSLELLEPLRLLPSMNPSDALSLVRSARSYQNGLWLAESEPALTWLLLVSALETAALHWRSNKGTPVARFQASKSEFFEYLSKLDNSEVVWRVAEEFKDSFGATRNFLDFVLTFRPQPPANRPLWGAIDWSDDSLRQILKVVYDYRSKALHAGKPFPAPMCASPYQQVGWPASTEKPHGHVSMEGGVWLEKDIPLLLHTFDCITRGTLLNWWRSLGVGIPQQS